MKKLSGGELRRGTGDVQRDLEYAQAFLDGLADSAPLHQDDRLELRFAERAVRCAMHEIRQLQARVSKVKP